MSEVITKFEEWFKGLSAPSKKELLDYINSHYTGRMYNESYYAGPSPREQRGLYSGPNPNNANVCPACHRPL